MQGIFFSLSSARLIRRSWSNNNRLISRSRGNHSMSISTSRLRGVDRGALIGHLSNKAIVVVSSVDGGLDTAIREGNGEGASNFSLSILSLSLLEISLRVVISHSILIGIRLRGQLLYRSIGNRGRGIGWRGSIGWGACS